MKALGLAAVMAKAGVPVPAAAPARLPCFTSVLADIGDEQSLTANLSTFSGHLKRCAPLGGRGSAACPAVPPACPCYSSPCASPRLLARSHHPKHTRAHPKTPPRSIQGLRAEADGKCLVLLDELGTGTDPGEGAALGVALLRRLARGGVGGGALTVATTHHSVMTKLKFEDPRWAGLGGRGLGAGQEGDGLLWAACRGQRWSRR
jgi:DNA mismatch repair protein MutS2